MRREKTIGRLLKKWKSNFRIPEFSKKDKKLTQKHNEMYQGRMAKVDKC